MEIADSATDQKLLVTIEEAARRLSIGRSHLYRYIASGELPSVRIGRSRRIVVGELHGFVSRAGGCGVDPSACGP